MYEVVYYSKSGNTRKVAEAIAGELKVAARDIKTVDSIPEDAFVFLGTGCYGAVIAKEIDDFIEKNRLAGRKIAFFTTSAFGSKTELAAMEKHVAGKGVNIVGKYSCAGHLLTMKRGHPDQAELDEARRFAREVSQN
jgi:flavodoxin